MLNSTFSGSFEQETINIIGIANKNDLNIYQKLLKPIAKKYNIKFSFEFQKKIGGGIAESLLIGSKFINGCEKIVMILGDNFFYAQSLTKTLQNAIKLKSGAKVFLHPVSNPKLYGIASIKNKKILNLKEKPKSTTSNLAVTGLYFFDKNVVSISKTLKPSKRKELEIIDLLNIYRKKNKLSAEFLGRGGAWLDAGSIDDYYDTTSFVSAIQKRQGFKIACLEEIALKKKWINKKVLLESIKFYGNCNYSKYLNRLIS